MKKWINAKWEDLRAGNKIQYKDGDILWHRCIEEIEHIGDRYLMITAESNTGDNNIDAGRRNRYKYDVESDGENSWQRLVEVELPDDWYLVKRNIPSATLDTAVVKYKKGDDLFTRKSASVNPIYAWDVVARYTILKRATFKDLPE